MNNRNLIIYDLPILAEILTEIQKEINFKIISINHKELSKFDFNNLSDYLVITKKKLLNINNQFLINQTPVQIFKFLEKLNIRFLKEKFSQQSKIEIGKYIIDLNSRNIIFGNQNLKLTEKEINTIVYISKSSKEINIEELQLKVWGYNSDLETHTVETHIYRLRKKFLDKFNDDNFILSKKNGYTIK